MTTVSCKDRLNQRYPLDTLFQNGISDIVIYLRYLDIIDKCTGKVYVGDLFLKKDKQGISTEYLNKKAKTYLSEFDSETDLAEKF